MSLKDAIVVKVTERHIVIIHPEDGTFANIPRTKNHIPLLGENISYRTPSKFKTTIWIKFASMAAAVFLGLFGWLMFQQNEVAATSYIVVVDINPSLEIYTDREYNVLKVVSLNADGEKVLQGMKVTNQKITEVIHNIINRCVEEHYLNTDKLATITTAIIAVHEKDQVNRRLLSDAFEDALSKNRITAQVQIQELPKTALDKAHQLHMSLNKYQMKQLQEHGGISIPSATANSDSVNGLGDQPTSTADFHDDKNPADQQKNHDNNNPSASRQGEKMDDGTPENDKMVRETTDDKHENGEIDVDKEQHNATDHNGDSISPGDDQPILPDPANDPVQNDQPSESHPVPSESGDTILEDIPQNTSENTDPTPVE